VILKRTGSFGGISVATPLALVFVPLPAVPAPLTQ
jgi:hypothetical protein